MTPLESLMLELIPQRLTPAPKSGRGPTEQWAAAERQRELWRVAAECVSDAETVAGVERMAPVVVETTPPRPSANSTGRLPYLATGGSA